MAPPKKFRYTYPVMWLNTKTGEWVKIYGLYMMFSWTTMMIDRRDVPPCGVSEDDWCAPPDDSGEWQQIAGYGMERADA